MNDVIRLAASVIVLREGPDGDGSDGSGGSGGTPRVLVLERSRTSRFLPGYLVFPGGSVDPGDAGLAERWFDDPGEASRAAAVRELAEETGLALTAEGLREPGGGAEALAAIRAAPPRAEMLAEAARWIAPVDVPVRFDARFFTVVTSEELEPVPDGVEAERAWWANPHELLDDWAAGDVRLYWPTWFTLARLAEHLEGEGTPAAFRFETREPTDEELERMPRSTFWEDAG